MVNFQVEWPIQCCLQLLLQIGKFFIGSFVGWFLKMAGNQRSNQSVGINLLNVPIRALIGLIRNQLTVSGH